MAYRIANQVDAPSSTPPSTQKEGNGSVATSGVSGGGGGNGVGGGGIGVNGRRMDEEEERDAVFFRLEMLGYRVGQGLVERFVFFPLLFGWQIGIGERKRKKGERLMIHKRQILKRPTSIYGYIRRY